jgi:protein-tyrosine phosphatase
MRRIDGFPLWIGTARDARDIKSVLDAGIEAIVDLAMEEPPISPTRELVYLRFPLLDGEGNPTWLLRMAMDAVEELVGSGVQTLVACGAGMSRSPAIAAMVMSQFMGVEPSEVLATLRAGGPCDVSPGLWRELGPAWYSSDQ